LQRFSGNLFEKLFRGLGVFQALELFARLEADGFARRDANFFAGAGIAPDAGLAGLDAENAESAEFDALAAAERLLERFEDGFNGLFRFGAADICRGYHGVYNVQLDHASLLAVVARC